MKKEAFIALVSALAIGAQSTALAEIGSINFDYETGECRVQGYFGNNETKAAVEVLKPSKTVNDSDAYAYVIETEIGEDGKFDSLFTLRGTSGDYLIRVGAGNQIFEKKFTFISKDEYDEYAALIKKASSWDDIRIVFEKNYGRLKSICKLNVAAEDKERVYKTLFDAIGGKDISTPEKLREIVAEVILLDGFMGEDENPNEALEALFDSFDDKYLPAVELWKNTSLTDADIKAAVVKDLQNDTISSLSQLQEKFAEAVICEGLKNVSSKGKEVQILEIVNSLMPFDEYDYFSGLSDSKKNNILQNMSSKFSTTEEYAENFDKAVKKSKSGGSSSSGSSKNNSISSGANSIIKVDSSTEKEPQTEKIDGFIDIDDFSWAKNSIISLYKANIIQGKANGIFAPKDNVKREEFTSMVVKALGIYNENAECTNFEDVKVSDWYYKAVASAYESSVVKGISETLFGAGSMITRQDAAHLCRNAAAAVGVNFVAADEPQEQTGVSYEYSNVSKDIYSDLDEVSDYAEDSVKALSGVGIINGMTDGTFRPKDNMTRAQAAVLINRLMNIINEAKAQGNESNLSVIDMLKTFSVYTGGTEGLTNELTRQEAAKLIADAMGIAPTESNDLGISDCGESEYAPYVYAAAGRKVMEAEDGKFRPDDLMDVNTALTVIVKALGYDALAVANGGYPDGYRSIAIDKGILEGISGTGDSTITKLDFLKMIYNALEEDIMEAKYDGTELNYTSEDEVTFLNAYKNIYKEKGQITANYGSGIVGETRTNDGEIIIDGRRMTAQDNKYAELIGRDVTYYYKDLGGGDYELVYASVNKKTKTLKLNVSDISEFKNMEYTYMTDEMSRYKTIELTNAVNVIYNNRTVYDFGEDELLPKSGTVEFVDYDGDGVYGKNDVVIVESYKNIVVAGKDVSKEIIYDKYSDDYKLDLTKFDKVAIEDKNGKTYGLREIREWDILSAVISPDNEEVHVYLSDEYIQGICSTVDKDEKTVEIEKKEFDMVSDFRGDWDEIKTGKTVTAYTDIFGNVAAVMLGSVVKEATTETKSIVILTQFDLNDDMGEENYFIKSYDKEKAITYRELEEKISFNGTRKKAKDIGADMAEQINKAILITVGENGKVTAITTAAQLGEDDDRGFWRINNEGESLRYGSEASHFGNKFRKGSVVYTVPKDGKYTGNIEYYAYNTASFINDTLYVVDGYVTDMNSRNAEVVVYKAVASKGGSIDQITGFVIGKVENRLDADDNVYKYIEGINYYEKTDWGTAKGFEIDSDVVIINADGSQRTDITVDDLKPGDCIRYGLSNGKINTIHVVYDYSENELDTGLGTQAGRTFMGYAYQKGDNGSSLVLAEGTKKPEEIDITKDSNQLKYYWIRTLSMVTIVDMTQKKPVIKKGTMDDVLAYCDTNSANGYSKCVLFSEWGATIYGLVAYIE